jgi:hypothetical protein
LPKLSKTRIAELIALDLAASFEAIRSAAPTPLTWWEAAEVYLERNPAVDIDELAIQVQLNPELFALIGADARQAKLLNDKPTPSLLKCEHCGALVATTITLGRWHGDNCPQHPIFGEANIAKRKTHLANMRARRAAEKLREAPTDASIETRQPGTA